MDNVTIIESFELPSKGKIYNVPVNPVFQLRSMTTEDEMKRLSHSEDQYKLLSEIMDSCIITDIGISCYDMHIGDYQYILHRLRAVTYGSDYKISSICPFCGNQDIYDIDLDSLEVMPYDEITFNKYRNLTLPKSKKNVDITFITPRMLDQIEARKREDKRKATKTKSSFKEGTSLIYTLNAIVTSINGTVYDPIKKEQFLRKLELADTNSIMKYGEKLNSLIGLVAIIDNICTECGGFYKTPFRLTSEFFGPSIE